MSVAQSPDTRNLPILNIAAYKFVRLSDLATLRAELQQFCRGTGMRGTILLSPEGINLFVAGPDAAVESLIERLQAKPELLDLEVKRSRSDRVPFSRMLVKLKREIIAFGVVGVDPVENTSAKVTAENLKRWLDDGEPVTLLDVRNDYEFELGSFENAMQLDIDHFRHFPDAVQKLPDEMKSSKLVMFCTGGIRCEKAGPMMEQAGFEQVYQLDGGILKYFEQCGGAHYRGECFVFDQRVSLDPQLQETDTEQCFVCQATLTADDRKSPMYVSEQSCPACYKSPDEAMEQRIAERNATIIRQTDPLPGKTPYENRRPLNVPARCDRMSLIETITTMHPHVSGDEVRGWCSAGLMRRDEQPLSIDDIVRAGERIELIEANNVEPDVNPQIRIIYEDHMLVVAHKPAPLPMHASGRFNRNTLNHIIDLVYAPQRLRIAHRLDANTTGVVVLSRTKNVAALVQPQFERGEVHKQYLARVMGTPSQTTFFCDAPISATATQAGARIACDDGMLSRTEFEWLRSFDDGTSLLLAKPITGRTNQIRLHAAHLGLPILGDPLYQSTGLGDRQTLSVDEAPLCLHAWKIELKHPENNRPIEFCAEPPAWAETVDRPTE